MFHWLIHHWSLKLKWPIHLNPNCKLMIRSSLNYCRWVRNMRKTILKMCSDRQCDRCFIELMQKMCYIFPSPSCPHCISKGDTRFCLQNKRNIRNTLKAIILSHASLPAVYLKTETRTKNSIHSSYETRIK